jgi:hypothetical protein
MSLDLRKARPGRGLNLITSIETWSGEAATKSNPSIQIDQQVTKNQGKE